MTRSLHTQNQIVIDAPMDVIFRLAADVTAWPNLLAHYRYVRILEGDVQTETGGRVVRMGARRGRIPVSWTSRQILDASRGRIAYHHIGGITRGMDVEWRIEAIRGGCRVTILHDLGVAGTLLRLPFARRIAGRHFIGPIADRTLAGIKRRAEREYAESRT